MQCHAACKCTCKNGTNADNSTREQQTDSTAVCKLPDQESVVQLHNHATVGQRGSLTRKPRISKPCQCVCCASMPGCESSVTYRATWLTMPSSSTSAQSQSIASVLNAAPLSSRNTRGILQHAQSDLTTPQVLPWLSQYRLCVSCINNFTPCLDKIPCSVRKKLTAFILIRYSAA